MVGNLLNWDVIYSIFIPCFGYGIGLGLFAFLLGFGLKFMFSLFENLF